MPQCIHVSGPKRRSHTEFNNACKTLTRIYSFQIPRNFGYFYAEEGFKQNTIISHVVWYGALHSSAALCNRTHNQDSSGWGDVAMVTLAFGNCTILPCTQASVLNSRGEFGLCNGSKFVLEEPWDAVAVIHCACALALTICP